MDPFLRIRNLFVLVPSALSLWACRPATTGPLADLRASPHAPNVLLITIDTLRADHLGLYGYERPTSPRLDAFAREACVFDAAQASSSWTLPGLASVLTSEFTSTHHCWSFGSRLDESFVTLTEVLLAAGYDTACVTSHVFTTTRHGLQQGFVHFDDSYAYPALDPEDNVTSNVISDRGIEFIREKAAVRDATGIPDPWFLWLHYFDPHERYVEHPGLSDLFVTPGKRDNDTIRRDLYDGEIRYTDRHVGRVFDVLQESGFDESTIVVVLSDHGEEFLDHGGRGHGHSLFGELVRVPFVLRAPGVAPRRIRAVVRTVDVFPTVLELTGLNPALEVAGRSLVPLLEGRPLDPAPALAEVAPVEQAPLDCLVEGPYKLVRELGATPRVWLFDLARDPGEHHDLSGKHADVVRRLTKRLHALKQAALDRGRTHGGARELELTPGLTDVLEGLGYLGGDD